MFLATGLYTGYLPKAPGTWGSLAAIPIHLVLITLEPRLYAASLIGIFILAVITAGGAEKILDRADPGVVVIDEIIGMLIALIGTPAHPLPLFLGFVLFRLFDITKPPPIGWLDRSIHGGLGIVLDDCAAGLIALVALRGLGLFIPL